MKKEYKDALSEVSYIVSFLNPEIRDKIPDKFYKVMNKEKTKKYVPKFDYTKSLNEQELSKETYSILSILYKKYILE